MKIKLVCVFFMLIAQTVCVAKIYKTVVNGSEFSFEIANTHLMRAKGLSKRQRLDPDQGMVFFFTHERYLKFWMKDTEIPLRIAFLSDAGQVLQIETMKPYDLKTISSTVPCRLALEANVQWFEDQNIQVGQWLPFSYCMLEELVLRDKERIL